MASIEFQGESAILKVNNPTKILDEPPHFYVTYSGIYYGNGFGYKEIIPRDIFIKAYKMFIEDERKDEVGNGNS